MALKHRRGAKSMGCCSRRFAVGAVASLSCSFSSASGLADFKPSVVDPACLDYFQSNIRAAVNSVWDRIAIDEQAVADFRRMKEEMLNQETWYGADVTSDAALVIGQTAQAVKTTANFVRDSVGLVAGPGSASGRAAVTVAQTVESVVYKVVHDEGSLQDIAVGVIKDAGKIEEMPRIGELSKIHDAALMVDDLVSNVEKLGRLEKDHKGLRDEVTQQLERLDRQIEQHRRRADEARFALEEYEREMMNAAFTYCQEKQKAEQEKALDDLEKSIADGADDIRRRVMERNRRAAADAHRRDGALTDHLSQMRARQMQLQRSLLRDRTDRSQQRSKHSGQLKPYGSAAEAASDEPLSERGSGCPDRPPGIYDAEEDCFGRR